MYIGKVRQHFTILGALKLDRKALKTLDSNTYFDTEDFLKILDWSQINRLMVRQNPLKIISVWCGRIFIHMKMERFDGTHYGGMVGEADRFC